MRQSDEPLSFVTKAPLERLLPHARPCQFCKGAVICTGEEPLEAAYFILSGSCELRGTLDGHEEVLETFGPGEAFGGWERGAPDEPGTRAVAAADSVLLSLTRKDLELLRAQDGHQGRGNGNGHAHPAELIVPLNAASQPAAPSHHSGFPV